MNNIRNTLICLIHEWEDAISREILKSENLEMYEGCPDQVQFFYEENHSSSSIVIDGPRHIILAIGGTEPEGASLSVRSIATAQGDVQTAWDDVCKYLPEHFVATLVDRTDGVVILDREYEVNWNELTSEHLADIITSYIKTLEEILVATEYIQFVRS